MHVIEKRGKKLLEGRSRLEERGNDEVGGGLLLKAGGREMSRSLGCLIRTSFSSTSGSDISKLISHIGDV